MIAAHIYIRSGASDAHIICASDVLPINDEEFRRSNPFFYWRPTLTQNMDESGHT